MAGSPVSLWRSRLDTQPASFEFELIVGLDNARLRIARCRVSRFYPQCVELRYEDVLHVEQVLFGWRRLRWQSSPLVCELHERSVEIGRVGSGTVFVPLAAVNEFAAHIRELRLKAAHVLKSSLGDDK